MNILLKTIQFSFRATSGLFPKMTEKRAFMMFQRIRNKKIRRMEQPFYERSKHLKIPFEKEAIDAYELGNPKGELVFLIHGWDSNAGCMGGIAEVLKADKRIVAFNLPAHGFHKEKRTNLLNSSQAFEAVLNHYQPKKPFSVVGHSFGAAVTIFTLAGLDYPVHKIVLLSTPDRLEDMFLEFKKFIHLGDKPYDLLLKRVHRMFEKPLSALNVSDAVADIDYQDMLIIHDKYDRVLDFGNAESVARSAPKVNLVAFQKIGHYRMLWKQEVMEEVERFLMGEGQGKEAVKEV